MPPYKPADFDAFWNDVRRQADSLPLEPEITADPLRSTDDVSVYQVYFTSLDNIRIAGWYCRPTSVSGILPGLLTLPGYQAEVRIPLDWARQGYAALNVAPRGKLKSHQQFNPGIPNLLTHNITDRNTYAYRGMIADAWRGLDFLLAQKEIDPSRIGMAGSSQSGGLTIITSALRPEIKAASAGAPFLCAIPEAIKLTDTYPYQEINDYLRVYPDSRDAVMKTLSYFDGLNFAGDVSCPIIVNIGLQDNICPPDATRAVFEAIGSTDKKLYPYDGQGHDAGAHLQKPIVTEFLARHLKKPGACS
jgi:cephalosporin-C deacetylase